MKIRHGEFTHPIRLTSNGIAHTLNNAGDDLVLAATRLPDLIRTAVRVGAPERPKDPLGKDRGVRAVHRLRGVVLVDADMFSTIITVKESNQGQLFYDLALMRKRRRLSFRSVPPEEGGAHRVSPRDAASKT